ncbi:MAG: hypothetical protein Q9174_003953, partial [Haloplaca sp. 1 TL-2023]
GLKKSSAPVDSLSENVVGKRLLHWITHKHLQVVHTPNFSDGVRVDEMGFSRGQSSGSRTGFAYSSSPSDGFGFRKESLKGYSEEAEASRYPCWRAMGKIPMQG